MATPVSVLPFLIITIFQYCYLQDFLLFNFDFFLF